MNNKIVSITGFVLVILGLLLTVLVFAFQEGIRKIADLESAALGSMIICLVGCILGWINFKRGEGKVAAILGTLLLVFYVFLLFLSDSG